MGHHPPSKAGGQNGGCVPLSVLGSASFPGQACSLCFPRACQGMRGVCGGEASGFSCRPPTEIRSIGLAAQTPGDDDNEGKEEALAWV